MDAKPGPIQPTQTQPLTEVENPQNEFTQQIQDLVKTAGSIKLSEDQKLALYKDIEKTTVEIRPDGLIYLPWMEYVSRLRNAFGMEWAAIPQGMPKIKNSLVLWGFYLVVKGKLAGFAIGEQTYYANNPTMTWGDACEGAKSNALMRLCKGIGIGLELWQPTFIKEWKEQFAEQYKSPKDQKLYWRKKKPAGQPDPEPVHTPEIVSPELITMEPTPAKETPQQVWERHVQIWTQEGKDYRKLMKELGIEKVNEKSMWTVINNLGFHERAK